MEYIIHTLSQLALAVRGHRKLSRLSQAKAAVRAGLLPKTISALENHPESSSLESFFKLLAALNLELVLRPRDAASGSIPPAEW